MEVFITKEYIMKKIIRLTESDLVRIVKRVINEQPQGSITAAPQKPQFPKDDAQLNALPNTPDGGKKITFDNGGGSDVLYPDGKTKSGKCWCKTKGGYSAIIATSCDGIENHCKGATAGWGAR